VWRSNLYWIDTFSRSRNYPVLIHALRCANFDHVLWINVNKTECWLRLGNSVHTIKIILKLTISFIHLISSCQSYNNTCPLFWQYDLWVSVILIVNGVSPYNSHITKYTGLRQFEKCYNVISLQCFYSTAQTLTSDISISTKMDMYHYKIDTK
jgi:hypothetical protein